MERARTKNSRQPWFLRHWRESRGETQATLAAAIGLSKPYVCQLEYGSRQYNQDILEALARHFACRPIDLLAGPPNAEAVALTRRHPASNVAATRTAVPVSLEVCNA